jgi:hypothetical protein
MAALSAGRNNAGAAGSRRFDIFCEICAKSAFL